MYLHGYTHTLKIHIRMNIYPIHICLCILRNMVWVQIKHCIQEAGNRTIVYKNSINCYQISDAMFDCTIQIGLYYEPIWKMFLNFHN